MEFGKVLWHKNKNMAQTPNWTFASDGPETIITITDL